MVVSVIHNLYRKNPYVAESIRLNLKALEHAKTEYEYILFNDNGDPDIEEDVKEFVDSYDVRYIYSDINYGRKMCTGGWVGALKYIHGDLIHNIGQDDIMTTIFYNLSLKHFEESDIYFVSSNGFRVDDKLNNMGFMINPQFYFNYRYPLEAFKVWFGFKYPDFKLTRANNNFLASGTIYRKSLHELIGYPDIFIYTGAADFEYWTRILFNEYKGHYISNPTWYYRMSNFTAGNEIVDGLINRGTKDRPGHQQIAIDNILTKYQKLVLENKNKFIEK